MKLRAKKHFQKLVKLGNTFTVRLFLVARKKDHTLYTVAVSKPEARRVIAKAKTSKRAALYIMGSYTQKYSRN